MPLPFCVSSTLFNCMLKGLFWDLLAAQRVFNKRKWVVDEIAEGPSSQVTFVSLFISCLFTSYATYIPLSLGGGTKASMSKRFPHMASTHSTHASCFLILRLTHSVSSFRFYDF